MKKKTNRSRFLLVGIVALLVLSITIVALAASPLEIFKKYKNIDSEEELYEKLSTLSFSEICDEINIMSDNNVDLTGLIFHTGVMTEKLEEVTAEYLLMLIEDKSNSENLRVICVQLLDYDEGKVKLEDTSRLEQILLDKNESSILRENIALMISGDAAAEVLKEVIFQDDEDVAFQALKQLNRENPKAAREIADILIKNNAQNEKLRIAIKVISSDLARSNNTKEKDKWVAYCMDVLNKSKDDALMHDTIVFTLSGMYYPTAIYEIINNDNVDDVAKSFSISQNYPVFVEVMENKPSQEDIEMVIKAMSIRPIDETIEALEKAVNSNSRSSAKYNLDTIRFKKAESALEKWKDDMNDVRNGR